MMEKADEENTAAASSNGYEVQVEPQFGQNEAKYVCDKLSLNSMNFGRYLVVMQSEFDTVISGEPYLAFILLIDMSSGMYFERIWNETVARGRALTLGDFVEACTRFFKQNDRPCLGLPMEAESDPLRFDCLISQTPVPRMISKSCLRVVHKEASDKMTSCYECLSTRYHRYRKSTNTKVELKEEPESDNESTIDADREQGNLEPLNESKINPVIEDDIKFEDGSLFDGQNYLDTNEGYSILEPSVEIADELQKSASKMTVKEPRAKPVQINFKSLTCGSDFFDHIPEEFRTLRCPLCRSYWVRTKNQKNSDDACTLAVSQLKRHMKRKHFWGIFKCVDCNFSADFADQLSKHIKQEEHNSDHVTCPECKLDFSSTWIQSHYQECVSRHIRKCHLCAKELKSQCAWSEEAHRLHLRKEHFWGEFKCSLCQFKSDFARTLIQHIMGEHRNVEERPVVCPDCSEEFSVSSIESHYKSCVFKGHKCPWCSQKYSSYGGAYNEHRKRAHFWGIFRCPGCTVRTEFAKELVEHMTQEEHMQDPFIKCPNCKSKYPMHEVDSHYKECLMPTQKCLWCDKIFSSTSGGYDMHRKRVHHYGVFKCPQLQCNVTLHFVDDLISHMQEEGHTEAYYSNCPHCRAEQPINELKDHYTACVSSGWKMGKCSKCKKRFPKMELLNHEENCCAPPNMDVGTNYSRELKKSFSCSICALKFESSTLLNAHKRKRHCNSCSMCNLTFDKLSSLNMHKRKEHLWAKQKFKCPQCQTMEETVNGLVNHMKQENHSLNQTISCPGCGETSDITELASHYQECGGVSRYKLMEVCCETCGKTLPQRSYKKHLRFHLRENANGTDDSLYSHCEKCGKRFASSTGLRDHIKYVHEGVKDNVTCDICLITFDRKIKLISHMNKAHPKDSSLQCNYCGKQFCRTGALKVHMRKHEEPKFKCSYCEKSLKSMTAWKAHERQHTGEKPFTCSICGAGFTSKNGLNQHRRGVHGIAPKGGKTGWYRKEDKNKLVNNKDESK